MQPGALRKVPNRTRELRERVDALVRQRIGSGAICPRCGARYSTYAEMCLADLDEVCPGLNAIRKLEQVAEKEVGLT